MSTSLIPTDPLATILYYILVSIQVARVAYYGRCQRMRFEALKTQERFV